MKKLSTYILMMLAALLMCGCGIFNSEYISVEDYAPAVQSETVNEEKITVRNITSLKLAIQTIINDGNTDGKIVFDAAYDGDPVADISKACWQVRTQDALCAYCVEDISYEISKIVTYYEAKISIGYTDYVDDADSIVHLTYSAGMEMVIRQAIEEGRTKLVLLVDHSSMSAEDVVSLVSAVYRRNPATAPIEPVVGINMYSGAAMQRLYEVNMHYGMSEEELQRRKACLTELKPFEGDAVDGLDESQRALLAYQYLCDNCTVDSTGGRSTVYDALIGGTADSEGIALAYVELCRQLDVDCIIVYGQYDWQDHCWNIIKSGDSYYHVDVGLKDQADPEESFMKTDEAFWETYRWDMSSYPICMPIPEPEDSQTEEEPESGEDSAESEVLSEENTFEDEPDVMIDEGADSMTEADKSDGTEQGPGVLPTNSEMTGILPDT